ncbi:hypothetical protein [Clostridium botulinum]|uniref:hypothetical protein n=1 Tax=Clostridium botulinum TaxID=1491 RepID=UPI001C9A2FD5|nr:hypothetical protein [Clostridium botulinum]MBY6860781.1 hypothetical protein [Clostridium botulinum]MBY6971092.1 hypothetical protein [Clostridium botulinum]MBY7043830.1 hypothetical protein [Clostridium botulinum]
MAKDDYIKARITKEEKKELKRIAEENKMDLSEMMLKATRRYAEHLEFNYKNKSTIDSRCSRTHDKLMTLKEKLKNKRK